MIWEFDRLMDQSLGAFKQKRTSQLAKQLAYGALTCMGRHTLTGMLTACGHQFNDWTSAYRLFANQRIDHDYLFKVAIANTLQQLPSNQPIVAHMDDTIIRKRGRLISWNRMAQGSAGASLPDQPGMGPAIYPGFYGPSRI